MNSKKWYASKTLWVNVLAIGGIVGQRYFGVEVLSLEFQALLLPVINVILRAITKEEIIWTKGGK